MKAHDFILTLGERCRVLIVCGAEYDNRITLELGDYRSVNCNFQYKLTDVIQLVTVRSKPFI